MPALSVIMPTYNGAKFLRPQLESILAQTHEDFELLVADDGSSDGSPDIVDEYVARDHRVRRIPTCGNRGQRWRLFELSAMAQSPFVAIADQDDVWHPERNERLLRSIGDHALAFGRSQLIDGDDRDLGLSILQSMDIAPDEVGPLSCLFHPYVSAHACIFRGGWFDPAVFFGTGPFDYIMGLEAFYSTGLVYDDTAVVMHRLHGGNQMNGNLAGPDRVPRFSRYHLRTATDFVATERVSLYLTLDQLSRSQALQKDIRSVFGAAAKACRIAWYQRLDFKRGKGRSLERELHELLDRFAASDLDRDFFARRVSSIVRPQWAPRNLVRGVRQYLDETNQKPT